MLQIQSTWHGRSMDHVLTYSGRQIIIGSQKPTRITRQKTCCASESNTSVRVVFVNRIGFDAPIAVFMAWELRGSCLNIFRTTNLDRISNTFMNYEAKDLLRNESNTSVRVVFANRSGFDTPIGVVLAWEERGSCLKIFRTTNRGQISETFTNYEAKDLLRKSADHVSTYSRRQITVGSQKPSRITRQKACCASVSNTSVRVVFANRSGFEAPIGVFLAWEERGSCLNIFRMTNRGGISETFTNYEAKDLLRNESNTSVRVVFANRSGFDAPIGVVLAWEERGSCLNIFQKTNRGRIAETFTIYKAKDLLCKKLLELQGKSFVAQVSETRRFALYLRTLILQLESSSHGKSVDHVLTYSGRKIAVGSQKASRITRQKSRCASASNTSIRVVLANQSGFDAPIGVVLAWDERGSCLNIFRTTNGGRISETFTNYEAKDLLRKSVDHVLTYSGKQNAVGSQKPSLIKRQKTCCASESNTLVQVVFANHSGFDAPIAVDMAWEERGSCTNIFQTTNCGRISETFTNYEAKDLLRNLLGMGGAWIMSEHIPDDKSWWDLRNLHELRGKRLVAQMSQTRRFALYLRTVVVLKLEWESSWFGRSVDHVLTYSRRQIAVGSQKPSLIMRQKTCCASESNTSVRVVFGNRSGFDAPIAVVMAWEERGSCLNLFWATNSGRISGTFTNYKAKDLLHK
ncbi:uncharacterized protein G2W53_041737 [Senna tora]|uniref:Uncharacterized protein n=1 Tax=Senna tora TaxID=362788 RepID=A0A834W1Q7_9FABA|nr:uncharacterized protein G2W53_041737 [Senna tora]